MVAEDTITKTAHCASMLPGHRYSRTAASAEPMAKGSKKKPPVRNSATAQMIATAIHTLIQMCGSTLGPFDRHDVPIVQGGAPTPTEMPWQGSCPPA